MQSILNLKIKYKLILLLVLGCSGLAVLTGAGFYISKISNVSINSLKIGMERVAKLESIRNDFLHMRLDLVYLISLTDNTAIEEKTVDYQNRVQSIKASINELRNMELSADNKQLLEDFVSGFSVYVEKGSQLAQMSRRTTINSSMDKDQVVNFATASVAPLYNKPAESIAKLVGHNLEFADITFQKDVAHGQTLRVILIAVFIAIAILTSAVGILILRSINKPLQDILSTITKVSEGDLTIRSAVTSGDEMGVLADGVNHMTDQLSVVMKKVTEDSMQVAAAATQLHTTAEQIATGAEEVAAQAATVATASEEMSATSADIANNCHLAADDSGKANIYCYIWGASRRKHNDGYGADYEFCASFSQNRWHPWRTL